MEYDFSKIKTEELRRAVFKEGCCWGIDCEPCPFCGKPGDVSACDTDKDDIKRLFKSELNRREKMENKMPKLESGMVIEIEWSNMDNCKYLVVGDIGYSLKDDGHTADLLEGIGKTIINVYRIKSHYTFSKIKEHLELIWSKKSDKDIKIEELEKELQHLEEDHSKKVSEIRDRLQELKG